MIEMSGDRSLTLNASGVDKNNLKWREKQLTVHCGVGSLIAIDL